MISAQTAAEIYAELTAQTQEQQQLLERRDESAGRCVGIVYTHWLLAEADHVFFGPIVRAFMARAAALGWHVFSGAPGEHWLEENLVEACVEHGADAIVVLGGADGNPDILRAKWGELPAVFIEYDSLGARSGHVGLDNEAAFSSVVFHLHEMGRSRIAHISGLLDTRVGAERLSAYRDTLRRLGYEVRGEYMETGDFYPEMAYESTKRLLALPEPPDAIACACDVQAVAAIKAVEEAGLRVPEDIAVTGFDDAPFAATMTPSLTTVRQPVEAMGVHAFDAAAAMVADPELTPPIVRLDGELIVRESSGAAVLA